MPREILFVSTSSKEIRVWTRTRQNGVADSQLTRLPQPWRFSACSLVEPPVREILRVVWV